MNHPQPMSAHCRRAALASLLAVAAACANVDGQAAPPATYGTVTDGGSDASAALDDTADATTDAAVVGSDAGTDAAVGPADSADASEGPTGSCQGACNTPYNPARDCQCNQECPKFGNCCQDYGALCAADFNTCAGRCSATSDLTKPCQCTWDCAKYGSCCPDFIGQCHANEGLDWALAPAGKCEKATDWLKVKFIPDGDTVVLEQKDSKGDDIVVRFLLVDTPEMTSNDCFALDAKKYTSSAIAKSAGVCLIKESKSDDKDVYGRLLRYVYVKEPSQPKPVELNLRLLRLGLARVLYPFAKGNPYEELALLTMAKAKEDGLGGWKACGWVKPK